MTRNTEDREKRAYRIQEFCAAFGIGATKTFEEIATGRLRAFKVGRARLISREAAEEWLKAYETNAQKLSKGQEAKRSA